MQIITFSRDRDLVTMVVNGRRILTQGWKGALDSCKQLDGLLRDILTKQMVGSEVAATERSVTWRGNDLSFRHEHDKVLVLGGNPERLLFDMNTRPSEGGGPSIARQVWSAWSRAAREAELESENGRVAERVARDAAILHRSGSPVGITDHPQIKAEAQKLARDDRDLRRFMQDKRRSVQSSGLVSDEVLGTPSICIGTRTPLQLAYSVLAGLSPETRRAILAPLVKE